jgi:uncharacterized protein (DUF58 family)
MNYLDPDILSKIKGMELRARLVVEGFLIGVHRSPYHGFSSEFTEHRPYMPGDEIKRIDWKVYGRTDRFYMKQFEEETNLRAYIILDSSKSMDYSSKRRSLTKFEYASYIAASLAWFLVRQKDAVSLTLFNNKIQDYISPSTTRVNLGRILALLDKTKPEGKTRIAAIIEKVSAMIKKKSLCILISDLLDDEEEIISSLRNMRAHNNEVIVFHILDPIETNINLKESAILRDMETGEEISIDPERMKKVYIQEVKKIIDSYKRNLYRERIDYFPLNTRTPLDKALYFSLARRERLWRS